MTSHYPPSVIMLGIWDALINGRGHCHITHQYPPHLTMRVPSLPWTTARTSICHQTAVSLLLFPYLASMSHVLHLDQPKDHEIPWHHQRSSSHPQTPVTALLPLKKTIGLTITEITPVHPKQQLHDKQEASPVHGASRIWDVWYICKKFNISMFAFIVYHIIFL